MPSSQQGSARATTSTGSAALTGDNSVVGSRVLRRRRTEGERAPSRALGVGGGLGTGEGGAPLIGDRQATRSNAFRFRLPKATAGSCGLWCPSVPISDAHAARLLAVYLVASLLSRPYAMMRSHLPPFCCCSLPPRTHPHTSSIQLTMRRAG